jgi:predicted permease
LAELISIFVNNIAPVLIVAGIGYLVGKKFKVDSQSVGVLIFNVFSPALVFFSLYDSKIGGHELLVLLVIVAVFQLTMAALSYGVMKFYGVERLERASVMLSSFCLNAGNYGLSIASFAFGEAVLARAVVVYIGNTALNYTLGVFVASSGHQGVRSALLTVLRVPAFYATVAAFLLRGFNIELPLVVFRSVSVLKDAAIPAMLVLLGLQLSQTIPVFRWKLVSIGLVLKLLIGPLLGIGLAVLFKLEGVAAIAFILQTAMPTAVITLVLAKQYQLDESLSLNLIMASTLLSPFTLSVMILLLRNLWPL